MPVTEPLVEITRGPRVESRHTGIVAVTDDMGSLVFGWGDTGRAIYPRSAVKMIQALPLVESGAADRFAYTDADLALACASHSGEPQHTTEVASILARAGLDDSALECGAHWPSRAEAAYALARSGASPTALHNNCSGKHTGFLALACHRGYDHHGYINVDHPVQVEVRKAIEDMVGETLDISQCGTDGCSIPSYALKLDSIATAFARLGTGRGLSPERARAAQRLRKACAAAPHMVAGTARFCTDAMRLFGERVFVKTGAEGVFCAIFPGQRLGVTLKIDDGAGRASEIAMAAIIERFVPMSKEEHAALGHFVRPEIRNWRGTLTGEMRPSAAFLAALGEAAPARDRAAALS